MFPILFKTFVVAVCLASYTTSKEGPPHIDYLELGNQSYRVQEFKLARQDIYKDSGLVVTPLTREDLSVLTSIKAAVEDDSKITESDILPPDFVDHLYENSSNAQDSMGKREKRQVRLSAITGRNVWPHNIVPYYIDLSTYTTAYSRKKITSAVSTGLKLLEAVCCVKFIEQSEVDSATRAKIGHNHSVRIFNGAFCWSHSGCNGCARQLSTPTTQDLSMATRCANDEIVQHEFGHVLGLTHEHTRTDMHKYIAVNYSLVSNPEGFYRKTHPEFINNAPYDLTSIQHYQNSAIVTHDPEDMWLKSGIGKLTHYDEWSINAAYCSAGCDKNMCKNDGYVTNKDGGCKCVCPEGLTGPSCERISSEERSKCGGTIHLTKRNPRHTIKTPNYPHQYGPSTACSWLVKVPAGKIIQSKITGMDLPADGSGCKHFVEIRDKLIGQVAREKCGQCQSGNCFTSKSRSSSILVYFDGLMRSAAGGGVEIEVQLLDDCSHCRGTLCYHGRCYPRNDDMTCRFEQGLLGECEHIRIHDAYQKSYDDTTWTESAWEIANRVKELPNQSSRLRSPEGRFHLQSIRPPPHTAGPYEGVFRIVPHLIYPGRSRCLKFKVYLCCDRKTSLRIHTAVNGRLTTNPLLTIAEHRNEWRSVQLNVRSPFVNVRRAHGIEMVFISSHTASSREGQAHLGIDEIEWSYGRCR